MKVIGGFSKIRRRVHGQVRADIAASFQRVALKHLEERTRRAAAWALEAEPGIRHLVVAGGVAANQLLRSSLQVCHISGNHQEHPHAAFVKGWAGHSLWPMCECNRVRRAFSRCVFSRLARGLISEIGDCHRGLPRR